MDELEISFLLSILVTGLLYLFGFGLGKWWLSANKILIIATAVFFVCCFLLIFGKLMGILDEDEEKCQ